MQFNFDLPSIFLKKSDVFAGKYRLRGVTRFSANVNVIPVRLSVVALVGRLSVTFVHLLKRLKFSTMFLRHFVRGHLLTSTENFTEIVPRERLRRGS